MQRALINRLSPQFLTAYRYILHPNHCGPFVCRSISLVAFRNDCLIVVERGVVWNNQHRNFGYMRRHVREKRPRNNSDAAAEKENDVFARNETIVALGREGKWKDILRLFEKEKDEFDNVNWATAFSQLGRIRTLDRRDPLFGSFVNEYTSCLQNRGLEWAGTRGFVNVVYTIGKIRLKNPATRRVLEFVSHDKNAFKIVLEGETQHVSNAAWSFATLGLQSPKLFGEIEKNARWLVRNGKPQEIANTAWAFAKLGVPSHAKLFEAIADHAEWLVENGSPQAVANVAWSFATLGTFSRQLFVAIENRIEWLVRHGNPQDISNTAWAFATLDLHSPKLFGAISDHADWLVQHGTPQAVANTAWACAKLNIKSPQLFAAIEHRASWLVREGNDQAIANIVSALAQLNVPIPRAFLDIVKIADNNKEKEVRSSSSEQQEEQHDNNNNNKRRQKSRKMSG